MNWSKIFIVLLLVVIVGGAIAASFIPTAIPVECVLVSKGEVIVSITEEGKTRLIDRYSMNSPIMGVCDRIPLRVGDRIQAGQLLYRIHAPVSQDLDARSLEQAKLTHKAAEQAVKLAQSNAQALKASADYARITKERIEELYNESDASQAEMDIANAQLLEANARHSSANFQVEVSKHQAMLAKAAYVTSEEQSQATEQQSFEVFAPIDGQILGISSRSKRSVRVGDPIMEIGNPAALEIEVDVLSADAVRIQAGMQVRLERWGGKKSLNAEVTRIDPAGFTKVSALGVEEQRVLVIAKFTSPMADWQQLGDAYRVEANFILQRQSNVLRIPTSSIFRKDGAWAVFVRNGEKASLRALELDTRAGRFSSIKSGISEGEELILHPPDGLEDGSHISVAIAAES